MIRKTDIKPVVIFQNVGDMDKSPPPPFDNKLGGSFHRG